MKAEANSIHTKGKIISFMPWFIKLLKLTGTILNGNYEECKRLEHIKSEAKEALHLAGFQVLETHSVEESLKMMTDRFTKKIELDKIERLKHQKVFKNITKAVEDIKSERDPIKLRDELLNLKITSTEQ